MWKKLSRHCMSQVKLSQVESSRVKSSQLNLTLANAIYDKNPRDKTVIFFSFRLYVLQDLLLLSIYIQHTYMYKMKVKSSQAQKLFSIISGHISRQFYPLRNNRTHQSGSITNSETYPEGIMFLVFCSILF